MRRGGVAWLGLLAALAAFSPAVARDRPAANELIAELKAFERAHGLSETGNFRRESQKTAAAYRCYYTGKLELPTSYDGLREKKGDAGGCPLDERKYDVFFYPVEALATGKTPVTGGLVNDSIERLIMVVLHEDLHDSKQLERLDSEVGEPAVTFIGFRMAADFARQRFGVESEEYRNLSREAELFLAKARIVNRHWDNLKSLYAAVRDRGVTREEALAGKAREFSQLHRECAALTPEPSSFNACPAANNNAGLAFDATYTRYYPLIEELCRLQGNNYTATLATLGRIAHDRHKPDADAIRAAVAQLSERSADARPGAGPATASQPWAGMSCPGTAEPRAR